MGWAGFGQPSMGDDALDLRAAFREHHDFVWRSLAHLGVMDEWIDDAVQDVFVIAHRRRDAFDGRAPVRHWLYGIARNIALKYRERRARAATRESAHVEPPSWPRCGQAVATSGEAELSRVEAASFVERFLATLDPDQRAVFVLADIEGHSAAEIAALVGSNVNTVYSRLRLARRRFEQAVATRRQEERESWNP
jgi:RNA polymerase sigma-70 factor (ECF subfamily)